MNIYLQRNASGLGDWTMTATVITHIHAQRPDVNVKLVRSPQATPFLQEMMASFDINFEWVDYAEPHAPYIKHFVYKRNQDKHLIEGMIECLNHKTGLDIHYVPDLMCAPKSTSVPEGLPPGYVLMPSRGKKSKAMGKEWGASNFSRLAKMLSQHFPIVQTGASGDPILDCASNVYLKCEPPTLHGLIQNCRFAVTMVNGLCCLAGAQKKKAYTIYCGGVETPILATFPNQIPLVMSDANDIFNEIINKEKP